MIHPRITSMLLRIRESTIKYCQLDINIKIIYI
jgi:hypothetical protein